jgi:arylsulfatase A-like enzyme
MPARATIISGQHVRSHGVIMNGVPLPEDTPDIARLLMSVVRLFGTGAVIP